MPAERRGLSIVTGVGGAGQVGAFVARTLATRGDTVVMVAREESDARERSAELVADGLDAHGYACDLSDPSAVARLAKSVAESHGAELHALVNVAGGFSSSGPVAESDPATLDRMLDINLRTAFVVTRSFLPALRRGRGSIVYFASEAVLEGGPTRGVSAYVAAKSALVGLMRSVAEESVADGVRANAIAPGPIRTATNLEDMGSDKRYVEREEVAAAVAFLCSSEASAITGQVIRLQPAKH